MDKKYEKQKAKELLILIDQYESTNQKKEINDDLYLLASELYHKNQTKLSQAMIDVSLAILSFTQAAKSGGHFQPLDEFITDLKMIA